MDLGALIPIFALSIPIIAIWSKHQQKLAEMNVKSTASDTAERAAQYASQVTALEDRVRVLERIVTDKGYDVAAQIEALRDQRRVDDESTGVSIESLRKERA
jgi:hypothetical protein